MHQEDRGTIPRREDIKFTTLGFFMILKAPEIKSRIKSQHSIMYWAHVPISNKVTRTIS